MSSPINYDSDTWSDVTIGALGTLDISSLSDTMLGPYTLNSPHIGATVGGLTYPTSAPTYGNITIGNAGTAGGSGTYSTSPWQNLTMTNNHQSSLNVKGDAEFEGKVKINGQDLGKFMETISKRLAILVPNPEKLEHFAALKKAYDHYKTLEALCEIPKEEEEK